MTRRIAILLLLSGVVVAGLFSLPRTSRGAGLPAVDVALVIAIDVSGSVSDARWKLQRDGVAVAIASDAFARHLTGGQIGRVALTVMQWGSGQAVALPWRVLASKAEAVAMALELHTIPRMTSGSTCIGEALLASAEHLAQWEDAAMRRIIDLSGDGENNCGRPVDLARNDVLARGITINGLPIATKAEPDLADWYAANVIGGPGAFLVEADGFERFAEAFLKKLTVEIAALPPEEAP